MPVSGGKKMKKSEKTNEGRPTKKNGVLGQEKASFCNNYIIRICCS